MPSNDNSKRRYTIIILSAVVVLAAVSGVMIHSMIQTDDDTGNRIPHYGGAVITEPQREAPDNIYTYSGVMPDDSYAGFGKKAEVYGLTLFVGKGISDQFVDKIANVFMDMFEKTDGDNGAVQEKLLKDLYRYKACLPVVISDRYDIPDRLANDYSVCDIIMKTGENQVMEVVEHLLHATTDVGMNYTFNDSWGFGDQSDLCKAMESAVSNGVYDLSGYIDEKENAEVYHRIIVQEYAYWIITSMWDLQTEYGPHESEWTATTPTEMEKHNPSGAKLFKDTVPTVMRCPSEKVLRDLL